MSTLAEDWPQEGEAPLRQEDARRPSRQPDCLVVGNSPEFSKERAKGGNGLQTLLPTLWAGRAHGARPSTDKVTQWSIGLNTRPWEPGHKSATPGESNIQKGPLEAWGSIWDTASNEPTGKQLCMWGQGSSACLCATLRALSSVQRTGTAPLLAVPWKTWLQGILKQEHWGILLEMHHHDR